MLDLPCRYCQGPTAQEAHGAWVTQHIETACPMLTGLYPVNEDEFPGGVRCVGCNGIIPNGEYHVKGPPPPDSPFTFPDNAAVFGVYCIGCGATQNLIP